MRRKPPQLSLRHKLVGELRGRQDSKAESVPHPVELAAPAGEKNGAALHLNLFKGSDQKGAAPLRSLSGVFFFNACGKGFIRHPRGVANETTSLVHAMLIGLVSCIAQICLSNFCIVSPRALFARSCPLSRPRLIFAVSMASQDYSSTLTLTDEQKSSLSQLEPAFEHLLRDVGLAEDTIYALRHCRIDDRETFTGLADNHCFRLGHQPYRRRNATQT